LKERGWLLKNAAGVTRTLGFIIPSIFFHTKNILRRRVKSFMIFFRGKIKFRRNEAFKKIRRYESLHLVLGQKNLSGGILYHDGQFDDARLAIDLACTSGTTWRSIDQLL
jgi:glycerol-3-phosphate dehydrogenase